MKNIPFQALMRLTGALQKGASGLGFSSAMIQDQPIAQTAIDIFKNQWASRLPADSGLVAGKAPLFEDDRITWAIQKLGGGVTKKRILELGPLEGGHTYMLEKAGATDVVAIEANPSAYLKCLIVKEIFDLNNSRFLCGDFISFGKQNSV